ncbi:MAG: HAD family hydrolase [Succinivibrio sp.]
MNYQKDNILAICYDFDRTLSPCEMQAQGYIQQINEDVDDFWNTATKLAIENQMDPNLSYMYLMLNGAKGKFKVEKKKLIEFGSKVALYDGALTWFDRINEFGEKNSVQIEHYIISSGLKEMIEGTAIADKFTAIYANSFLYDRNGAAIWPAQNINFTNKTQFLFRISKGTLDVNDNEVNRYFPKEAIRVPFENIVYIGDSQTDIPCMKLATSLGGHAIGVFDPKRNNKAKVHELIRDNRIHHFAPADYTEGSKLDILMKKIITYTAARFELKQDYLKNLEESNELP